jgi:hypothetical protein
LFSNNCPKTFMNPIKTLSLTLALAGVVATAHAAAVPITGDIGFGSTLPATLTGGSQTFLTATGLDFASGPNAIVNGGIATTGAFVPLVNTFATFSDFTFSPLPGGGANPVWTAGTFSFALTNVTATRTATSLVLDGTGTVSSTDVANWSANSGDFHFTMQGSGGVTFTFSADSTAPSQVPDGGATIALLGASLAGMAMIRRKLTV